MTGLNDLRLSVFLFAPRTGQAGQRSHEQLAAVWHAVRVGLEIEQGFSGVPDEPHFEPPPALAPWAARTPDRAGLRHAGPMLREMWWDVHHDTTCLSVTLAGSRPDTSWADLCQEWAEAVGSLPDDGLLGKAFVYTGLSSGAVTAGALSELIKPDLPPWTASASGWASTGTAAAGGLTVFDLTPAASIEQERHLIVTAPEAHDEALGDWIWRHDLAPLARYLLSSAKLRYEARLLRRELEGLAGKRDRAGAVLERLRPMLTDTATASAQALFDAERELAILQADEAGIIDAQLSLQAMRRTVEISLSNLSAVIGDRQADGTFDGNDRRIAGWVLQDIDDQLAYLDVAGRRAQYFGTVAERELARRAHLDAESSRARQERFGLLQTAILGAVLMTLTAIQAFGYTIPLPGAAQLPVISTLGALAFLLSTMALRHSGGGPRPAAARVNLLLQAFASGAVAACLLWTGAALTRASGPATALASAAAFAAVSATALLSRWARNRSGS